MILLEENNLCTVFFKDFYQTVYQTTVKQCIAQLQHLQMEIFVKKASQVT